MNMLCRLPTARVAFLAAPLPAPLLKRPTHGANESYPPPPHTHTPSPAHTASPPPQHGRVSSVDLDTHAEAPLDSASSSPPGAGGSSSEAAKPSMQALVHMEADGKVRGTEAAVHALIMTHNLTLADRRLRVSFLSGERHLDK